MRNRPFIKILLGLLLALTLFHMLVMVKVIPYHMVWGGRLQNDSEMYSFEALSIFINLFLAFVLLLKGGFVKFQVKKKIVDIILWIFFIFFVLNTVGNLLSETNFEKSFAVVTVVFATLIWVILKRKNIP